MQDNGRDMLVVRHGASDIRVRVPVYARIQHEVRHKISSGVYAPGDRIPSETELAQRYETTRATVARALQELVFDGTIVRRAGAGSFVAPAAAAVPLDTRRLRSFEEQAAESGETVDYELVEYASVQLPEGPATKLRLAAGSRAFHLERLRLIKGVPLSLETRYMPDHLGNQITGADLTSLSIHQILQARLGITIGRIEASVRAGAATPRIAKLLGLQRGRPLLIRDHVLVGQDNHPILTGASYYTEQFRLDYVVHENVEQSL